MVNSSRYQIKIVHNIFKIINISNLYKYFGVNSRRISSPSPSPRPCYPKFEGIEPLSISKYLRTRNKVITMMNKPRSFRTDLW